MPIVVSAMPKWRFDAARVVLPKDWDIRFLVYFQGQELIDACRDAEYLMVPASMPPIDAATLKQLAHLKLLQSIGAGYDRIDVKAATSLNIPVANIPGENAKTVAEFTVGVMIALGRRLVVADAQVKQGRYANIRQTLFTEGLSEITGSKVGLVGLGAIGLEVAHILNVLGANVSYYALQRKPAELEAQYQVIYKELDDLLAESDIVSLHVPLNEATHSLIGQRQLALMPPGSFLINTARGEVVEQKALAAALESGRIAGAAIDVFTPEPPGQEHPLLQLSSAGRERLLATPHIAGVTAGSMRRILEASIANIERVMRGQPPLHIVNS